MIARSRWGISECSLPNCSISQENGDLTIASLLLDYEGWYTCQKHGVKRDYDDGLHYVEVNVNGK